MPQQSAEERQPEARRKEIFQALVEAQDQQLSVSQSRRLIVRQYSISENQLREIEQEGLDGQWPPL